MNVILMILLIPMVSFGSGSAGGGGSGSGPAVGSGRAAEVKLNELEKKAIQSSRMKRDQSPSGAEMFDHGKFATLLKKSVVSLADQSSTQVKYSTLDTTLLQEYLSSLSHLTESAFQKLSMPEQTAFLINAYNAFTLKLVKDHYPVKSIKKIGGLFRSPWKITFFELRGQRAFLDKIEHEWIRGAKDFNEPRIHFAVNCASVGCPALLEEPFLADKLDEQLESATLRFLRDSTRNRLEGDTLKISSIFDWYGKDFERSGGVKKFVAVRANEIWGPESEEKVLKAKLEFLAYDWNLNEAK